MPLRLVAFRFDEELIAGMRALQARDGVQPAEIARRAVRQYLAKRGMVPTTARKAATGGVDGAVRESGRRPR